MPAILEQNTTLGGQVGGSPAGPLINQKRQSFDKEFPRPNTPIKLSEIQKANFAQQVTLFNIGPNESELAFSRISAEVTSLHIPELLRTIVEAWRAECFPVTRGAMSSDDRKLANQKSDELAARKLHEGSAALAKADAAIEAARRAQEIADQEQQQIAALWHELRLLPSQIDVLKTRLTALANERANLNPAALEEAYEQLYSAQFIGANTSGDPDRVFSALQQLPKKAGILDKIERQLAGEISKLEQRQRVLQKELK